MSKQPTKLHPTELKALITELAKRTGVTSTPVAPTISSRRTDRKHKFKESLFAEQRAFVDDPAKRKAALCTRRAGKTTCDAFMLIEAALDYDDSLSVYVALTRENIKKLMWPELKRMNARWDFGMDFNETSLTATFPNKSEIWLCGAQNADDVEKLRGPKYPLVVLDESASFGPHIESLVVEIINPALRDLNGTLALTGTPGRVPTGFFYEVTTGKRKNWSVHSWSLEQNTYLPPEARDLALIREEDGLSESDPRYRREYLGEWVSDATVLVYRFNAELNYGTPPQDLDTEWYYNLAVDLGYDDDTAFVVGAFSPRLMDFYIVYADKRPGMIVHDIAQEVRRLDDIYKFSRKVGDSGGLGKMILQEMNVRYGLSILPAEKKDKFDFIEHFNSDMLMGRIKVPEGCAIVQEWVTLPWDEDRRHEDPGFPNHLADAALYAWRDSKHFAGKLAAPATPVGSPEWYRQREREEEIKLAEQLRGDRERSWWECI